jgi:hypothetical protein
VAGDCSLKIRGKIITQADDVNAAGKKMGVNLVLGSAPASGAAADAIVVGFCGARIIKAMMNAFVVRGEFNARAR